MRKLVLMAAALAAFSIAAKAQISGPPTVSRLKTGSAICSNNDVVTYVASTNSFTCAAAPGASGGEANTASNLGSGAGTYASKSGVDLRFKSLRSTTTGMLTVTGNASEIDFTIVPSGFTLSDLGGSLNASQIAQSAATSNQYLKWNGSAWAPATIAASEIGSGTLSANRGGLGADASGFSGVLKIAGGTASVVTGTGSDCIKVDGTSGSCGGGTSAYQLDGAAIASRATLNLITGTGITPAVVDDSGNSRVNVTYSLNETYTNGIYSRLNAANTFGASATMDLSAASVTTGFRMPTAATAAPTLSGQLAFGTNNLRIYAGYNGATRDLAWRLSGTNAARPTTLCLPGDTYYQSDSTPGLYVNSATGSCSWTLLGGSGLADPGGNGIVVRTSSNTTTARTLTGTTDEITISNGDGTGGNPTAALSSTVNMSSKTLRIPNSTSLPGACTTGDIHADTDATSKQRTFLCESTNTWVAIGGSGDVVGPGSAVSGNIATFNGTGGKTIQDGGKALPSGSIVGTSDTQTLTAKSLTTPIITAYTVGGLPAATTAGQLAVVTDGLFAGDCTIGGGSKIVLCRASGSAWVPTAENQGHIYSLITRGSINASSTTYAGFAAADSFGAETSRDWMSGPITRARMCILTSTQQSSNNSLVFTLRDDTADTALVVTIEASQAAGLECVDASVTIAEGSMLAVKAVNNATGTSATVEGITVTVY
jgi:hypothetical protein